MAENPNEPLTMQKRCLEGDGSDNGGGDTRSPKRRIMRAITGTVVEDSDTDPADDMMIVGDVTKSPMIAAAVEPPDDDTVPLSQLSDTSGKRVTADPYHDMPPLEFEPTEPPLQVDAVDSNKCNTRRDELDEYLDELDKTDVSLQSFGKLATLLNTAPILPPATTEVGEEEDCFRLAAQTGVFGMKTDAVGRKWMRNCKPGTELHTQYVALKGMAEKKQFRETWAKETYKQYSAEKAYEESFNEVDEQLGEYMTFGNLVTSLGGQQIAARKMLP